MTLNESTIIGTDIVLLKCIFKCHVSQGAFEVYV